MNLKKTIQSVTERKIHAEKLDGIVAKIVASNIDSKENRKEHVQAIRENSTADKKKIKQGVCPKCGGTLKQRKGKYGAFTGCSNYPKCKYTLK